MTMAVTDTKSNESTTKARTETLMQWTSSI